MPQDQDKPIEVGILAGEMSGDILGAGLMAALRRRHPNIRFRGIGGELMTAQGLVSRVPMDRLSVMGLVEPLKRLPELLRLRADLARDFLANPPDVFIGIDSPDFCLGLEQRLREGGIPTVHYVSPTVWAWRRRRIRKIARAVDLMLTLFPFEAEFYEEHGVAVRFVGHPLADAIPLVSDSSGARRELGLPDTGGFTLALLPGSRHGEVERLGPPLLAAAARCQQAWPETRILLSAANRQRREQLEALLARDFPGLRVDLHTGGARRLVTAADLVILASGTATLETLLLKKPMIVCYRMGGLSFFLISRLLKVPHFAMPNLLAGERVVPEFSQGQVSADTLFAAVRDFREQPERIEALQQRFTGIHELLRGNADETAADAVTALIQSRAAGRR